VASHYAGEHRVPPSHKWGSPPTGKLTSDLSKQKGREIRLWAKKGGRLTHSSEGQQRHGAALRSSRKGNSNVPCRNADLTIRRRKGKSQLKKQKIPGWGIVNRSRRWVTEAKQGKCRKTRPVHGVEGWGAIAEEENFLYQKEEEKIYSNRTK